MLRNQVEYLHWPQLSCADKCIVMALLLHIPCLSFPDAALPTSLVAKLEDGLGESFGEMYR